MGNRQLQISGEVEDVNATLVVDCGEETGVGRVPS